MLASKIANAHPLRGFEGQIISHRTVVFIVQFQPIAELYLFTEINGNSQVSQISSANVI